MEVLSIVSTKGGVGKTTLAVHLAVAAHALGKPVLLLDLDQQGSAVQWWKDRQRTLVELGTQPGARFDVRRVSERHLPRTIAAASGEGFDLVIIDTPPHADFPAARAVEVADLVLMPITPSSLDLYASKATIALVRELGKPAFAIVNRVPHNSPTLGVDAGDFLEAKGIKRCPLPVTLLQPYVRCMRDGLTAPELVPDGRHAAEIGDLWNWCNAQLQIARLVRPQTTSKTKAPAKSAPLLGDPFADLQGLDAEEGVA